MEISTVPGKIPLLVRPAMEKKHVLVVDDEKLIRWSLKMLLEQSGYRVTAVEDGASALRVLAESSLDAVLLDYRLPDMTGIDVLCELRKHHRDLPVLMVTSCTGAGNVIAAMEAGANDYLAKPFRKEAILLHLARILGVGLPQEEDPGPEAMA